MRAECICLPLKLYRPAHPEEGSETSSQGLFGRLYSVCNQLVHFGTGKAKPLKKPKAAAQDLDDDDLAFQK